MFLGDKKLLMRNVYLMVIPYFLRRFFDDYLSLGFPSYYKEKGVVFIHIPKAAGTSFAYHLYGRSIAHLPGEFLKRSNAEEFDRCVKFAISRNPYSRLVSSYRFLKQGGTDIVPVDSPEQYQIADFESFERFVLSWLRDKDVDVLDFCLKRQAYFLRGVKSDLDYLGKVEEIEDTVSWLSQYHIADFSDKNRTGESVDYKDYYKNDMVRRLVYDIYREDFEMFGYSEFL